MKYFNQTQRFDFWDIFDMTGTPSKYVTNPQYFRNTIKRTAKFWIGGFDELRTSDFNFGYLY